LNTPDSSPNARLTESITRAAAALRAAEQPLRILGLLAWPDAVREAFFRHRAKRLPEVDYPRVDPLPVREALNEARRQFAGCGPARPWFERVADRLETAATMMCHLGSAPFHEHSRRLYGAPGEVLTDSAASPLKLARRMRRILDRLSHLDLGAPDDPHVSAEQLAARMRPAVLEFFGDEAPAIELVDQLSANATAGPSLIKIRRSARFTDRDAGQLIHHEAGIHVTTALNGRHQDALPILAAAHPGTTRTQEGLAVFAEFITGSMDVDRLSRLTDRVLAIQMAVDGADFIEVFDYFRERGADQAEAFEQARRVFRGGVISGGAPFTKDVVYLDGLLRVHDFLRSVVAGGRADLLLLLFCGKLDLEDVPVLGELAELGLLRAPKFLPPWAADRRFLVSYLAYSGFLGRVRIGEVHRRHARMLHELPPVRFADDPD
jgi:uncharacterized protein (TIGR02421 family)